MQQVLISILLERMTLILQIFTIWAYSSPLIELVSEHSCPFQLPMGIKERYYRNFKRNSSLDKTHNHHNSRLIKIAKYIRQTPLTKIKEIWTKNTMLNITNSLWKGMIKQCGKWRRNMPFQNTSTWRKSCSCRSSERAYEKGQDQRFQSMQQVSNSIGNRNLGIKL